jgi:hypothetical protein
MTSAAGPAELQPRGRLQLAYASCVVGAMTACAQFIMVACIDDGFRAADIRVLAPTRTHFTHPTKVNDAATHINRLRRMGGARQIRHKNGDVHRAQPIMVMQRR